MNYEWVAFITRTVTKMVWTTENIEQKQKNRNENVNDNKTKNNNKMQLEFLKKTAATSKNKSMYY